MNYARSSDAQFGARFNPTPSVTLLRFDPSQLIVQISSCPSGLPPAELFGSAIVANAICFPSALQLGQTSAAFELDVTSVIRLASPSTRSIVHRLNHRLPRCRDR